MKLSTGRSKLYASLKLLRQRWDVTKPAWNDPVCLEFEAQTYEPLEQQVAAALRAIDRLAQILEKAEQDLS